MADEGYDEQLARDLLEHSRFSWIDGMLDGGGRREAPRRGLVVLSDPSTAGCLLHVLDGLGVLTDVVRDSDGWIVAVDLPQGLKGFAADHLGEAASWALMEAWAELGKMVES